MARGLATATWAATVDVRHKGLNGQHNTRRHALNEHTHLCCMRSTKYGYFESISEAIIHSLFLCFKHFEVVKE